MRMRCLLFVSAVTLMVGCPDQGEEDPLLCNGFASLCEKSLDQITLAMTHNSHAAQERGYLAAAQNQFYAVPRQLEDGIRALNFDVHQDGDALRLCHGWCGLGSQDLAAGFAEIYDFLASHPREVVLLDFQNEVSVQQLLGAIELAGLTEFAHSHVPDSPWPTLQEMIASGKRLVIYTDDDVESPAWLHAKSKLVYATAWGKQAVEDLTCELTSGPLSHGLFELNHTLTNPIASPELAEQANHNPFLLQRALECTQQVGKKPNLISVDFYSIGEIFSVVNQLNGVGAEE